MRDYDSYRKVLLTSGVPQAEADSIVADVQREDEALDARTCPKCDKPLDREVDAHQGGMSSRSGCWFKYRCKACGYIVTRKEIS